MLWNAENGSVRLDDTEMDYLSFGRGEDALVLLPGLGDGFKTVKGLALPMAWQYRIYAKSYKVYVFSRKNALPEGYSTRDMASDQAKAMEKLGIQNACVVGISQGGMIAQYLAIDHPALVKKLVLAVTLSRPNERVQNVVGRWISMAKEKDYKNLLIDTAEKSYSEGWLKSYRRLYPFFGILGKPKDPARFIIEARSCISHNAFPELGKIQCPTLVIGGECDRIVGAEASRETAARIQGCKQYMYPAFGHGAYEEAPDFDQRVLAFLAE